VLVVRFFLNLTGYPQLGGSHLHVAHVLWGGLLLAVAVLVLLAFLTRPAHRLAALLGGVGFGLFIDEVGKFLTKDTNYFFLPAVSVIYVVFVLIFIGLRTLRTIRPFSPTEYLLNALLAMQEVALRDLDPEEQRRALRFLGACDASDPLVEPLRRVLEHAATIERPVPRRLTRVRHTFRRGYQTLAGMSRFHAAIVAFFIVEQAVALVVLAASLFYHGESFQDLLSARYVRVFAQRLGTLSFATTAEAAASALSAVFAVWGMLRIRSSRAAAFRMFERSVLVTVLLTQPFAFYREQFWALIGLGFEVVVLLALRYMMARERAHSLAATGPPAAAPA